MKPFNLDRALNNDPICLEDGRKARILAFDLKCDTTPLVVAIERKDGSEFIALYDNEGKLRGSKADHLFMASREGYIIIDKDNKVIPNTIFPTYEKAKEFYDKAYKIIKIEW